VCRFPSEWERETIVQRYGGLTRDFRPADGDEAGTRKWQRFVDHAKAITFDGLPAEFLSADWRFHPREFIGHLRKCVWLSNEEFARCIPRKSLSGTINWAMALARSNIHARPYNLYIRKYCGDSRIRYAHNLAQSYVETGLLRTTTEDGSGKKMIYGPMYGRGYHQLTWAENYKKYGEFKMIPDKNGAYKDARITEISMHPKDSNGALVQWYPKYDPDIVSSTAHAGESSGFYWVSKKFRKTENMNRVCDLGLNGSAIGFNSWLVNGGGNGYINRQQFGKYLENILLDAPLLEGTQKFNYPSLTNELTKNFPPSQQVSQDQSEIVDYEIQIP
jgi:predicted chitinase